MIEFLCSLLAMLPIDCLQHSFMQQAMLCLLLLAPVTAMLGIDIIHFKMSFFSDAIAHSVFTGVGLGLLFAFPPKITTIAFALFVGLAIVALRQRSNISSDLAIGVVFSTVVAFGIAVVSREPGITRDMQQFLFGDILTIGNAEILFMMILLPCMIVFQFFEFNNLIFVALNPVMAKVYGIHATFIQCVFAMLLAMVVVISVWTVGVMLVTALLIVPAACARNLARSIFAMFWWAIAISTFSSVTGLILSAQPWMRTASGATIVMVSCVLFALSTLPGLCFHGRKS